MKLFPGGPPTPGSGPDVAIGRADPSPTPPEPGDSASGPRQIPTGPTNTPDLLAPALTPTPTESPRALEASTELSTAGGDLAAAIAAGDVREAMRLGGTAAAARARDVKQNQVIPGRKTGKLAKLTEDDTWDRFLDHVLDGNTIASFRLTPGDAGQISAALLHFLPEPFATQYKHIRKATADIYGEHRHLALARAEEAAAVGELSKTQLALLKMKLGLYRQEMEDRDPETYKKEALVQVNVSPMEQSRAFVASFRMEDSGLTTADYGPTSDADYEVLPGTDPEPTPKGSDVASAVPGNIAGENLPEG